MQETHFVTKAKADDLKLHCMLITAEKPKAIVQIIHGMQEHKERYYDFMRTLAQAGYACVINDIRGHGASVKEKKDLGFFYDKKARHVISDVSDIKERTLSLLGNAAKDLPYFVFAHSMGTLIARTYIKEHDDELAGLILSGAPGKQAATGAGLALVTVLSAFKGSHATSKLCEGIIFGKANKNLPGTHKLRWLSKNSENVIAYENDPLCGVPFTLNGYKNLLKLLKETYKSRGWALKNPDLPILFLAGEDDPITLGTKSFNAAQKFLTKQGYKQVDGKLYPELRHELLQEEEAEKITQDIVAFLDAITDGEKNEAAQE